MKALGALVLAALAALPASAAAQSPLTVPLGRLSITPFIGTRPPIFTNRSTTVILAGDVVPVIVQFDNQNRWSGVGGAEAELRLFGPVGIVAGGAYSNSDDIELTTETPSGAITSIRANGPTVWFLKAGISYRFPEPKPDTREYHPAGFISLGPALVVQDYGDGLFSVPGVDNRIENWAMNISAKAFQPLGSRHVNLYLGVEDYAVFWNPNNSERQRISGFLNVQPGTVLSADFGPDRTNVFMLDLGLSFRI